MSQRLPYERLAALYIHGYGQLARPWSGGFPQRLHARLYGGSIEMRLDALDGWIAGVICVTNTQFEYKVFSTGLTKAQGKHDVYFVFRGSDMQKKNLFNFDWWQVE